MLINIGISDNQPGRLRTPKPIVNPQHIQEIRKTWKNKETGKRLSDVVRVVLVNGRKPPVYRVIFIYFFLSRNDSITSSTKPYAFASCEDM